MIERSDHFRHFVSGFNNFLPRLRRNDEIEDQVIFFYLRKSETVEKPGREIGKKHGDIKTLISELDDQYLHQSAGKAPPSFAGQGE